jgi:flavin reductase
LIAASNRFAVNVLSPQQGDLARHYSMAIRSTAIRAGGCLTLGRWLRSSGRPPLLAEALVAFDCEVQQAVECATHTVFIGRVAFLAYRAAEPLVYRHGTFGRFAEMLPETPDDVLDY